MITFKRISTSADYEQAKLLFLEYAESLNFDLQFQNFEKELANINEQYSSPEGGIVGIFENEKMIGCAGVRKFKDDEAELKRMFIQKTYQGRGLGKKLLVEAINLTKDLGYKRILLDTMPTMISAIYLYESYGFKKISPYRYNPFEGAIFMALELE